jgi:hypothetical protein
MYQKGEGVPIDYAEAMSWLKKAAINGSSTAMYNIGVSYQKGLGVSVNREEATKWFAQAAASTEPEATFEKPPNITP